MNQLFKLWTRVIKILKKLTKQANSVVPEDLLNLKMDLNTITKIPQIVLIYNVFSKVILYILICCFH